MKLIVAIALVAGVVLLAACAAQPGIPEAVQLAQVDVAAQHAPEVLEEIRLNAETINLYRMPTDSDIVCQRAHRAGTHIRREICLTRAEWRRLSREAQEWMRTDGQQGSISQLH